jgi:hypothetical protein
MTFDARLGFVEASILYKSGVTLRICKELSVCNEPILRQQRESRTHQNA